MMLTVSAPSPRLIWLRRRVGLGVHHRARAPEASGFALATDADYVRQQLGRGGRRQATFVAVHARITTVGK